MGGRGNSSGLGLGRGEPSVSGKMKTAIVYHGSWSDFSEFDFSKISAGKSQVNQYGEGFYFADTPEAARLYGDTVYKVKISYSTDRKTAKATGRAKDFQYDAKTGFWVIPHGKQDNIKIIGKRRVT